MPGLEFTQPLFATGEELPLSIGIILLLGVGGQWLAGRLRIPGVLLLLTAGILVGPVFNVISPEEDFGPDVLFPVVGLAVGLLLYEGGLGLKLDRLTDGKGVIVRLVTVGALVTWLIGWGAITLLFDVPTRAAALIAAILVVSGPTVVIPLLHLARPREPTGSILRWEGIVIDPVGATLAIVVLDVLTNESGPAGAALQIGITLGSGAVVGIAFAGIAMMALHKHLVPDHLLNPAMLAIAVATYAIANLIAPEGGLMSTTMLGIVLANQNLVPRSQLTAFSEDVGHLILGTLFIVLGALVNLGDLAEVLPQALILIAVLVFIARPAAVWLSTLGAGMALKDRQFLAWMAPRGIVAASVATVFSNTLVEEGAEPVPELVPIVFATVIVTVALYGLTATAVAKRTRVAKVQPNGVALASNNPFVVDLADVLARNEIPVLVVSTSASVQRAALRKGLLAYDRPLDSDDLDLTLDGVGVKLAVLITDDENFAVLAAHHLTEHLGRANVYQVKPDDSDDFESRGRNAFGALTFFRLQAGVAEGGFFEVSGEALDENDRALFTLGENHSISLVEKMPADDDRVIAVHRPSGAPPVQNALHPGHENASK